MMDKHCWFDQKKMIQRILVDQYNSEQALATGFAIVKQSNDFLLSALQYSNRLAYLSSATILANDLRNYFQQQTDLHLQNFLRSKSQDHLQSRSICDGIVSNESVSKSIETNCFHSDFDVSLQKALDVFNGPDNQKAKRTSTNDCCDDDLIDYRSNSSRFFCCWPECFHEKFHKIHQIYENNKHQNSHLIKSIFHQCQFCRNHREIIDRINQDTKNDFDFKESSSIENDSLIDIDGNDIDDKTIEMEPKSLLEFYSQNSNSIPSLSPSTQETISSIRSLSSSSSSSSSSSASTASSSTSSTASSIASTSSLSLLSSSFKTIKKCDLSENLIDPINRKMLIDQLLSPKNSIRNRHLKKALLTIKSSSTKLRDKNNDNNNNTIGSSDSFEMNDEIGEEKTKLSSNILVSKLDDSGAKMNHSDRFKCGSSSSNSSTLAISETFKRTRYSGVGRYRCPWPECSYTPHFLRDLRRHMFKHTGDKRYKCSQCRFVSVWKTSLLQHQRKKHGLY